MLFARLAFNDQSRPMALSAFDGGFQLVANPAAMSMGDDRKLRVFER